MRAVICRAWGAVEDLTVEDIAPPRPGPGEVLIAVGQAPLDPGMHPALFSLARAEQAARVSDRAVPVVSGGETHAVYYPLSAVGAQQ
jgi:hypothetical protein